MFSSLSTQKTNPLQNTQPTINVVINASEVREYDKDPRGLQYRPVATKLVRPGQPTSGRAGMLVTTNFDAEHIPIGIADGRGRPAANSSFCDIAITTSGPASIITECVKTVTNETLVPQMLLYPHLEGGKLCLATENYMKANLGGRKEGIKAAADQIGNAAGDAAKAAEAIISAYHSVVRPFGIVVEHKRNSDFVNIILGPY